MENGKGLTQYGDTEFSLFLRKAFIKGAGYPDDALDRPIVGITDTGSGFNPCHGNTPQLIEAVKRGVMLAGGIPIEFPTISIHEIRLAHQHVSAQPDVHGHGRDAERVAHGFRGADRWFHERPDSAGCPRARCLCWSKTRDSQRAPLRSHRRGPIPTYAVTASSTWTPCARRMEAAISVFCRRRSSRAACHDETVTVLLTPTGM